MKKNAMLKIAAVLLVAVLLTTCAISSTFAKYVSEKAINEDSARVAKWGLAVDTKAWSTGFADKYGELVDSADGDKVVAPGTKGTLNFKYAISGTAEVDAKVVFDAEVSINADLAKELKFYDASNNEVSLADIETAIEALTVTYDATQGASDAGELTYTWVWAFDGLDDDSDTELGESATDITVSIKVTAQVVQVGTAVDGATNYPA